MQVYFNTAFTNLKTLKVFFALLKIRFCNIAVDARFHANNDIVIFFP